MDTVEKTKSKPRRKPTPKPKPVAVMRHRKKPDRKHLPDIEVDLKSQRSDLKLLLKLLNPVLREVIRILKEKPTADGDVGVSPGGYHNITFCQH
jgi:hypothetical protein